MLLFFSRPEKGGSSEGLPPKDSAEETQAAVFSVGRKPLQCNIRFAYRPLFSGELPSPSPTNLTPAGTRLIRANLGRHGLTTHNMASNKPPVRGPFASIHNPNPGLVHYGASVPPSSARELGKTRDPGVDQGIDMALVLTIANLSLFHSIHIKISLLLSALESSCQNN